MIIFLCTVYSIWQTHSLAGTQTRVHVLNAGKLRVFTETFRDPMEREGAQILYCQNKIRFNKLPVGQAPSFAQTSAEILRKVLRYLIFVLGPLLCRQLFLVNLDYTVTVTEFDEKLQVSTKNIKSCYRPRDTCSGSLLKVGGYCSKNIY